MRFMPTSVTKPHWSVTPLPSVSAVIFLAAWRTSSIQNLHQRTFESSDASFSRIFRGLQPQGFQQALAWTATFSGLETHRLWAGGCLVTATTGFSNNQDRLQDDVVAADTGGVRRC